MIKIPTWLLSDEQIKELVVTWFEVLMDKDATTPTGDDWQAYNDFLNYARLRIEL